MTLQYTMDKLSAECGWTEGEWIVLPGYHDMPHVRSEHGGVAVVNWAGFDDSDRSIDEHCANARLCAAAPKLAAALYNLLDSVDVAGEQSVDDALDALSAAGVDVKRFGR